MSDADISTGIDWLASSHEDLRARHRYRIPERLNIAEIACDRHARDASRIALIEVDGRSIEPDHWQVRRYSFADLKALSDRFAAGMRELGIGPGDRVGVFLPQRMETAVIHLATLKLGAISMPLSPLFRADALAHRLRTSGARLLVTDAEHAPFVAPIRADLPDLSAVVSCEDGVPGTEPFARVAADLAREFRPVETAAHDPAMLLFTSGTEGLPKGAVHAHRFLPGRLSGFELVHQLQFGPHSTRPFWTPADWAWVAGLVDSVFVPWTFGRPIAAFRRKAFDVLNAYELIVRVRVRSLFLPPTALGRLREYDDANERFGLEVFSVHTAGERLSADAYHWAAKNFGSVFELYGMTEMGAVIGGSPYVPVRPGAMGKPYPGHDVELLDADLNPISGRGEGQIAVRRPNPGLFLGYLNDPVGTAERFHGEFFLTGDIARRDDDGYYWYVGRNDDMFNTSGYRVGPTEIEQTIAEHPAVAEVGVVGAPDADRGTIVKAFIVLKPEYAPTVVLSSEIQRFVKQRLAVYEYPRSIAFVRELPRTITGKIRRSELREHDAEQRFGAA